MNVALYPRVSTGKQYERDLSIPSQIKEMELYCKGKGWNVVKIYREEGASGRDENRPVFQEMIYEATKSSHPFDAILTVTTSRFFRDATQARVYKHMLEKSGVKVLAIKQEVSDDPMGKVIEGIFELIDQYESQVNGLHTKRAMLENAKQGNFNGARLPFGFQVVVADGNKKRLEINESEAAIVKEIFAIYLGSTGKSLGVKGIADMLNNRGDTFRGEPWKKGTVHSVLTQEAFIGKRYFNRKSGGKVRAVNPAEEWVEVSVPRIIDDSAFEAAQQRLKSRSFDNSDAKRKDSPTLLTGLLKCKCGASMTLMSGKGGAYRYYRCTRRSNIGNNLCDTPNIPVDDMNALVLRTLKQKIFTADRIKSILDELCKSLTAEHGNVDSQHRKLAKELSDVNAQLIRLSILFEQEALPIETLKERSATLAAKQSSIKQRIDDLSHRRNMRPMEATPEVLDAFCRRVQAKFNELESGFAKEYLKLFVNEIVVNDKNLTITGNAASMASCLEKKSAVDGMTRGAKKLRPISSMKSAVYFLSFKRHKQTNPN